MSWVGSLYPQGHSSIRALCTSLRNEIVPHNPGSLQAPAHVSLKGRIRDYVRRIARSFFRSTTRQNTATIRPYSSSIFSFYFARPQPILYFYYTAFSPNWQAVLRRFLATTAPPDVPGRKTGLSPKWVYHSRFLCLNLEHKNVGPYIRLTPCKEWAGPNFPLTFL